MLLIINIAAEVGGAEVQLLHLARGLAADGHRVTVCAIDSAWFPPEKLEAVGIDLVELHAKNRWQRLPAIWPLVKLARKADVVQCTMWDPSLWGRLAAIIARRPVVIADHATDRTVQTSSAGRGRADWIALHNRLLDPFTYATVACATSQRPVLLTEGVGPEKIVYIPNGIPLEQIAAAATDAPDRSGLGLPPTGPIAVQVGLFRAEKNQIGALEAFAEVRREVPDAQLVFVGAGPQQRQVEARAAEIGADWAHFLGLRSDVPALLHHADLMLLPSRSDAMPMVVLEAMSLGLPVLATDVGDVGATLGDGGIVVPVDDRTAFVSAAIRLLSDPVVASRYGEVARERGRAFGADKMVCRYEDLFQGALDGITPTTAVDTSF